MAPPRCRTAFSAPPSASLLTARGGGGGAGPARGAFRPGGALRARPAPPARAARAARVRRLCVRNAAAGPAAPEPAAGRVRVGLVSVLLFFNAMVWALVVCPAMGAVAVGGALLRRRVAGLQISLMQFWMRATLRSSLLRVRVAHGARAPPPDARVLYVCNHQSALDVFVTAFLLRRVRYLMPARAFRVPLIGWMMRFAGWVPVEPGGRRAQMDALRRAGETLRESSLVVFPEGTPSGGALRKFPSAVFRAAQAAGVLVCPVTIHGTGSMSGEQPGVPTRRPTEDITVTVHDPIEASLSLKEIAQLAFIAVRSALPERLRGD